MKTGYGGLVVALLFLGFMYSSESLAATLDYGEGTDQSLKNYSVQLRHFTLKDGVSGGEFYGSTEAPVYQPLTIHESDVPGFEYMAVSPYYKVFFTGTTVRMNVGEAWITFELTEQDFGQLGIAESVINGNSLSVSHVFESVDVSYKVETSLLTETLTLREFKEFDRVIQNIQWEGMTPEHEEDGSILFLDKNEKKVVKILPPHMKDATGAVCEEVHYELIQTKTGYELHKVINENGLHWLKEAVYPVIIDPSMQTFEDAWESSGLTPYGQYFKNVKEYVNPATGYLTVMQTDLVIPGRGLDVIISRVYEIPAVFYGSNPYDYETPPVDIGKGWQLNFPYIGSKYLHLWGGTVYKIEWSGNTFENHKGDHFTLVKNGDNTSTLTTASGIIYEFSTSGKLTEMKDLDQNTITFHYSSGTLTSITDTIGRTVSLSYANDRLWKITYNSCELEFSYDVNGCLIWVEDFLNRRTSYSYNTGYNNWLLSKIEYPTTGYTTYSYDRFTDNDYYKYYITDQRVYETNQVRHIVFSYTGTFEAITSSTSTVKNESDVVQGSYEFTVYDGLVTQRVVKNASSVVIRKYTFTFNARNEVTEENVYYDGSTLSYTNYRAYDNWGNVIYIKNAEGHEQFFSYANTSTSGLFIDNNNTIIRQFANAFTNSTVPSSVHTVLLGLAEKQDATYVREVYVMYDVKAHPTQSTVSFGNYTTWLTFSGTFNEKTGDTSFPIDLTGHTVVGNGALTITGLPSDDTCIESHSFTCGCIDGCESVSGSWSGKYFHLNYKCCYEFQGRIRCLDGYHASIGPFDHYPGTFGYDGYFTQPGMGQQFSTFTVKTRWKTYPEQVQYSIDGAAWKPVTSNLKDSTVFMTVPLTDGSHTLNFSESSSYHNKFSWTLYVPVDNTPETYTTAMTYDTYGNITSVTDAESNTTTYTYSPSYSYAYVTEISAPVGQDTITTKTTYDYDRGWILSLQQPKGVADTGYDTLYTYDVLGRVTKKEFPLLPGQSQRSYVEAVYDDVNRTVTIIDQLRHYVVQQYDKLGRLTAVKLYTGEYGSGTLYATKSYTYRYDNLIATAIDPENDTTTYTYDFSGRTTQVTFPDLSTISYSYDDTTNKVTFINGRNYERIYWYDWLGQLTKVEEEYFTDLFAQTTYQYDEIGNLTSITDAENRTTSYTHASLFGLTKIVYPDSTYEEYVYDTVGNLISFTDANENETVYTYDSVYRLTEIEYEDQSTVFFTYDLNSNRTRMDDNAVTTGDSVQYTYDHWNRLTSVTRYISQNAYTISYQYDTVNQLTTLTYPDSTQILYSYDDLGRTIKVKQYVDGVNDHVLVDGLQYNIESFPIQADYGNGLSITFSYDSMDRLSTTDVKDGDTFYLDLGYTYDNNSNITQLVNGWRDTDFDWNSQTESYYYDGLDRLTSGNCTLWSHTYAYDKVGNRTAKDGITYTINIVNEVTSLSDGTSFTYDANGNRIQKTKGMDTWDYTYDYANRLAKVEENSTTIGEYVYDGDSKRIQVSENGVTTTCIYAGLDVLYEETSTGTAVYIYGPTGLLAERTTIQGETNTFYYHTDHLGSTRLVTDESKTIVTDAVYHPFGEPIVTGEEPYLYTGKEKDETGLYYYGARYYDCDTGRFITRDPLAGEKVNPQSLNRYTYCVNNPVTFADPVGLLYSMTDAEGNRTWFSEFGMKGIRSYDPQGNKIFDSASVQKKIDEGDYVGAVLEILEYMKLFFPGLEVSYDLPPCDENGNQLGGTITVSFMGHQVEITVCGPEWSMEKGAVASHIKGGTKHPHRGLTIIMEIYFYDDTNMTAEELFHTVGHEFVHAFHFITGDYYDWEERWNKPAAVAYSEYMAWKWNLEHLSFTSYPGAQEEFERRVRQYMRMFIRAMK